MTKIYKTFVLLMSFKLQSNILSMSIMKVCFTGPPIVLNQQTEDYGDDLILSVMFYSFPYEFDIQWFLGNISLNGDPQYTITVKNTTVELKQYNVDVATEGYISNLTIHNFKGLASAVYNCKMSNTYGVVVEEVVSRPGIMHSYCL